MSAVTPLAILVDLSDALVPTFVVLASEAMFEGLKTSVMGILQETAGNGKGRKTFRECRSLTLMEEQVSEF